VLTKARRANAVIHDANDPPQSAKTLLVDTLFDLWLTREMLEGMQRSIPAAARIAMLFDTHGNGDHTFGNQLVKNARIIATRNCLLDMEARLPGELHDW
jgi:cyclase